MQSQQENKSLRIIFFLALLIINLIGIIFLENISTLKFVFILITSVGIFYFLKKNNSQILSYLITYLIIFNLYNLFVNIGWSMWSVTIILFLVIGFLAYYFIEEEIGNINSRNIKLFYSAFISYLILEIFLALLPWPTNLRVKSIVSLVIYYLLSEIFASYCKYERRIIFRKIAPDLIIGVITISLVVGTTMWYDF